MAVKRSSKGAVSGKGIVGNMKGKTDAKAAFVKLGNTKATSGTKYGKGKK